MLFLTQQVIIMMMIMSVVAVVESTEVDIPWSFDVSKSASASEGDELKFVWSGTHDVYRLLECDRNGNGNPDNFQCPSSTSGDDVSFVGDMTPTLYTIPETNVTQPYDICFVCMVGSHCENGMHITLQVGDAAGVTPSVFLVLLTIAPSAMMQWL